jgi:hypothetical protein
MSFTIVTDKFYGLDITSIRVNSILWTGYKTTDEG